MAKIKFSWNLPSNQWTKVLKGAFIAGSAAVLTVLAESVTKMDFGAYTPMIVASLSIGINYLRQAISTIKVDDEPTPPVV